MNPARLRALLSGEGLRARALRGTVFTLLGFGAQLFLRLLSNLVLTRLLFPEAFGLMALVMVMMTGLQMISDAGTYQAIVQSRRGDDPVFLRTAWSIQIGRGVVLGLLACALALPVAGFYDQPDLALLLPVAGLGMVIQGLQSIRFVVANRNLVLGRLTLLEIGSQAFGILSMILLAWTMQSVWALMIGALISNATKTILTHVLLPGLPDRLGWERAAFSELFHFGKFIFISSLAGFLVSNADRAVLGKFITIAELGVYNIGFFMASVPVMVCFQMGSRLMMPIYSQTPPRLSPANRRNARLARVLLSAGLVALGLFFALIGDWLIGVLYEETYALAGPIMVLLSLTYLPTLFLNPYGDLLLAAGKAKNFTLHKAALGGVQVVLLILLVREYGTLGAILVPGLAALLTYPLIAWFVHAEGGWDPLVDFGFLVVILLAGAGVLELHPTAVAEVLSGFGGG